MNPISIATKGKGLANFVRRVRTIARHYGLTSSRMNSIVASFAQLLEVHNQPATFPVTAVALQRNGTFLRQLIHQGIELAIHGYRHIDYSQLSTEEQAQHIAKALSIFEGQQIHPRGFRCPYLRWNEGTLDALRLHEFAYDSSQALAWDVVEANDAYRRALDFYGAKNASRYPALPWLDHNLVRIPYTLPDDEALVDRLNMVEGQAMAEAWLAVLHETYKLGELFVIGLHPERIEVCREALGSVLQEAESLRPKIWVATLADIATWWRTRLQTKVLVQDTDTGWSITIMGEQGVKVFARGVGMSRIIEDPEVSGARGNSEQGRARSVFSIDGNSSLRPFIAVAPDSSPDLVSFLNQQGYIVEVNENRHLYSYYFEMDSFTAEQQRSLLTQIEETDRPLVRLGRWPGAARCALAVTGDIDALTLWDYGGRFLGK